MSLEIKITDVDSRYVKGKLHNVRPQSESSVLHDQNLSKRETSGQLRAQVF